MVYNVNTAVFSSSFPFPNDVADKYLKLCKAEHLKVLIYIMRNLATTPSVEEIAQNTDVSAFDVKEALLFWADTGILIAETTPQKEKAPVVTKSPKPSRDDVIKRGLEDEKLRYLLNQTQVLFSRNLKTNEVEILGWIYDDLGFDVSLILYLIQYAKEVNKANVSFIEKTAAKWADNGIETVTDAEAYIKETVVKDQAWKRVCIIFGIEKRNPSEKELSNAVKWINEWKVPNEKLKEAYDICVDAKSKFIFSYTAKIINGWYSDDGTLKPTDDKKSPVSDSSTVTFDVNTYKELINSKDKL